MQTLKFKRLNDKATLPVRGTEHAAGIDLPMLTDELPDQQSFVQPGQVRKIPTGLAVEIPAGMFGLVVPRSSAFKAGWVVQGVIDSDYRGEIYVVARNAGTTELALAPGTHIAQLIILRYEQLQIEETQELSSTERGASGWGSTGRAG